MIGQEGVGDGHSGDSRCAAGKFGAAAVGTEVHKAIDPWIQVDPASIVAVGTFLRDDPRFRFDHLNDLCGVDYFEPDARRPRSSGMHPILKSCIS